MGLPSLNSCIILILCLNFTVNSTTLKEQHLLFGGKFPAFYVFGDSLVDSGNNNYLATKIKSNFLPYGSDFEGGKPTGRFSNGKTIADYIALYYGLPMVPAYMGLTEEQKNSISTGFNYASASCGVFPNTGQGKCLSLNVQVDLFSETIEKHLKKTFKTPLELNNHLADSLFMTAIGVNDYAFFYNKTIDANEFANKLLHEFLVQIERLHGLGARKFFINNIKPLGCYPNIVANTMPRGSCNDQLNQAISIFNNKLKTSLSGLKQKLFNTCFLYSDYFNFMLGLRGSSSSNIKPSLNATSPCCPDVYDGGLTTSCRPDSGSCKVPDNHIFFDPFHPTQLANLMYSNECFKDGKICREVTN
ncbi:unnamed protein product [Cochlearia groenlandica]